MELRVGNLEIEIKAGAHIYFEIKDDKDNPQYAFFKMRKELSGDKVYRLEEQLLDRVMTSLLSCTSEEP